jgi:DNA-binding NtrC family response regulator
MARHARVLLVIDDCLAREAIEQGLVQAGAAVRTCCGQRDLLAAIEAGWPKIIVAPHDEAAASHRQRTRLISDLYPRLPQILIQAKPDAVRPAQPTIDRVIRYIPQPIDPQAIPSALLAALCPDSGTTEPSRARTASRADPFLIGRSQSIQQVLNAIDRLANSDASVLIQGEYGTGKRLAAEALHHQSRRSKRTVQSLDCGELGNETLSRLLFGPNPIAGLPPMLEDARVGTIVLRELASINPSLQSRLIEWIRQRRPSTEYPSLVLTTAHDLGRLVANRRVRADLFLELSPRLIGLPPLRHRRGDIRLLIAYFTHHLNTYLAGIGKPILTLEEDQVKSFEAFDWPRNVRQLRVALIELALADRCSGPVAAPVVKAALINSQSICSDAGTFEQPVVNEADSSDDLGPATDRRTSVDEASPQNSPQQETSAISDDPSKAAWDRPASHETYWQMLVDRLARDDAPNLYDRALALFERQLFREILQRTGGDLSDSARLLGMTRVTFKEKIEHLDLEMPEP